MRPSTMIVGVILVSFTILVLFDFLITTDPGNQQVWGDYIRGREANCSRCLLERFNVTVAGNDLENMTPFMQAICDACKPMMLR
jgi:hypothetical protein